MAAAGPDALQASPPPDPLTACLAVTRQPSVLTLGVLAGGAAGALAGLAGGMTFIQSPAAIVVVPVSAVVLLTLWCVAIGAVSLACSTRMRGQPMSVLEALRRVARRGPAVIAALLPIYASLLGLAALQFALFALTRAQTVAAASDRPVALISLLFIVIFLVDVLALAATTIAQWILVPYVASDGVGPAQAYVRARCEFWKNPGHTLGAAAGMLGVAGAATMALIGLVMVALALASATQVLGGLEITLVRIAYPLIQSAFVNISVADRAAAVIIVTGIGTALGGAIGFGQTFGVAGGAGLKYAREAADGGVRS